VTGKERLMSVPKLRIILHIEKGNNGALTCKLYSIDQGTPDGFNANSVTFKDSTLEAKFDLFMASYEGKVSADGNSMTGTWGRANTRTPTRHDNCSALILRRPSDWIRLLGA